MTSPSSQVWVRGRCLKKGGTRTSVEYAFSPASAGKRGDSRRPSARADAAPGRGGRGFGGRSRFGLWLGSVFFAATGVAARILAFRFFGFFFVAVVGFFFFVAVVAARRGVFAVEAFEL